MDYEKAYNDALERAKAGKPMDEVFPELKESEDERIRKEIVRFIKESPDMGALTTKRYEQWLAWLEKQKEQKPLSTEETELNSIAFLEQLGYTCVSPGEEQKQEIISISEMVSKYRNADEYDDYGNHKGKPLNCMIRAYEQGIRDTLSKVKEQKPAEWSEDFEDNIRNLLHDKLTRHSEDGRMSWATLIDDKTLKDIVSGIWFYVGKEALKYPNKKKYIDRKTDNDYRREKGSTRPVDK